MAHDGLFGLVGFPVSSGGETDNAQDEWHDGSCAGPGKGRTAPRDGNEESGSCGGEDKTADPVDTSKFLPHGLSARLDCEHQRHSDKAERTEGKHDVKDPTPCCVFGNSTTQNRAGTGSEGPCALHCAIPLWPVAQGYNIGEDDHG